MDTVNRIAWASVFLLGTALFLWLEWADDGFSAMGWFILTSLWSAVCGIGYTVVNWFIEN